MFDVCEPVRVNDPLPTPSRKLAKGLPVLAISTFSGS